MKSEIRIHQYSGKENGIMILGSTSALNKLGKELVSSTEGKPQTVEKDWPENIVSRVLDSSNDYTLTFCIETSHGEIPATSKEPEVSRTIFFVFAVIGFIASIKWVVNWLF